MRSDQSWDEQRLLGISSILLANRCILEGGFAVFGHWGESQSSSRGPFEQEAQTLPGTFASKEQQELRRWRGRFRPGFAHPWTCDSALSFCQPPVLPPQSPVEPCAVAEQRSLSSSCDTSRRHKHDPGNPHWRGWHGGWNLKLMLLIRVPCFCGAPLLRSLTLS